MNITKTKFNKYRRVQFEGKYNMIVDAVSALKETGLLYEEYLYIIGNYDMLTKKYGEYNIR